MPQAARVLDATLHPGFITPPGIPTVLIMGSAAAVAGPIAMGGTLHTCTLPAPSGNPAHPPTPFIKGSLTVLIGGLPALRVGDMSSCGSRILTGAPTVLIGG
jgi:uncharacterized Zn-binding protein involved in type VI secretion